MAQRLRKEMNWAAAGCCVLALLPVAVLGMLVQLNGWDFAPIWRNVSVLSPLLLEMLLMFVINAALALGTWHFAQVSQKLRWAVVLLATAVAALCLAGILWDGWLWLSGRRFVGVDTDILVSGLIGRLLLAVFYVYLVVLLRRAGPRLLERGEP